MSLATSRTVRFRTFAVRPLCIRYGIGCRGRGPGNRPTRTSLAPVPYPCPLPSCTRKSRASLSNWQVAGEKETFLLVPSATRVHLRGAGPQDCQTSIIVIPVRPPYRDRVTCRDCMKEAREPLDRAAARSPFQKIRRHAPFPSTTRAVKHLVRRFRPPCPLPARCLLS